MSWSFTSLLLQRTVTSPGSYATISFVFEDKAHVWFELQGYWPEKWLSQVKEIPGFVTLSSIGEEGGSSGWRLFVNVSPYPQPKHNEEDTPTNKHYRWFHEVMHYMIMASTVLINNGAQFLWRWKNTYMLFFVPLAKMEILKIDTQKPPIEKDPNTLVDSETKPEKESKTHQLQKGESKKSKEKIVAEEDGMEKNQQKAAGKKVNFGDEKDNEKNSIKESNKKNKTKEKKNKT